MLALAPQILFGLGEEGGEPISPTSSWLQGGSASPASHLPTYKGGRRPGEGRRVVADQLPPPPCAGASPLFARGEPIPPLHGAHGGGRCVGERIRREEPQHRRLVFQQPRLGVEHPAVALPRAEGGEPEIPFEARLVRSVDAGRLARVLRLIAE